MLSVGQPVSNCVVAPQEKLDAEWAALVEQNARSSASLCRLTLSELYNQYMRDKLEGE